MKYCLSSSYILYFYEYLHISLNSSTCFQFSLQNINTWGVLLHNMLIYYNLNLKICLKFLASPFFQNTLLDFGNNSLNKRTPPFSFGTPCSSEHHLEKRKLVSNQMHEFGRHSSIICNAPDKSFCVGIFCVCAVYCTYSFFWSSSKLTPLSLCLEEKCVCKGVLGVWDYLFCSKCVSRCGCTYMWDLKQLLLCECLQAACWSFGVLAAADRSECFWQPPP